MVVAIHTASGVRARNGSARRASSSPARARTVTAMAAAAELPMAMITAAAHPGPWSPAASSAHRSSIGPGG
jgi:hypothetical protein